MWIILVVFLQTALFSLFSLQIRKLEEGGVSAFSIAGLQRYSIIPAIIFFAVTYKQEYFALLVSNPVSMCWILGISCFWGVGQFIGYIVLNSTSSLSFVYVLSAFMEMPILLIIGILINHDYPNGFILIAMALLMIALLIKPTQHKTNKRPLFKYGFFMVLGLVFINLAGHALDGAFYKNILTLFPSAILFGIAIYVLVTSVTLNLIYICFGFKKKSLKDNVAIKKHFWIAYSIPLIWFIASLPEGYSFGHLPLFTLSTIGAFGFLIKLASDLKNKRLVWNIQTGIFSSVIILSLIFSTLSLK